MHGHGITGALCPTRYHQARQTLPPRKADVLWHP